MRHRLFNGLTKLRTRTTLREQGYGVDEASALLANCESAQIEQAAKQANVSLPENNAVGAIGDGTIINAILEFLKSEQGQALIAALIQILLSLI
jgi:hypothetical protein